MTIGSRQVSWKVHAVVEQLQHVDGPITTYSDNHQMPALAP